MKLLVVTHIKSALKIATKFNIYAYDAYFLECADNLRIPLLTLDLGMTGQGIGYAVRRGERIVKETNYKLID